MIILIMPIGAPGSGKTTLNNYLRESMSNYFYTQRDEDFATLRKTNSLNKTRKKLFSNLELFFENVSSTNHKNPEKKYFVYLDSSNAKIMCREKFYQKLNPDKIIELNFNLSNSILQERVKDRYHPTFPEDHIKQKEMIDIISKNIEFSNPIDTSNPINNRITKIYINEPMTLIEIYQKIKICS